MISCVLISRAVSGVYAVSRVPWNVMLSLRSMYCFRSQLPEASQRSQSKSLVPHRGEILEFNRQVPLSRPLFDGFGDVKRESLSTGSHSMQADTQSSGGPSNKGKQSQNNHVVHERLPNGWTKKAVKRLSGEREL